MKTTKEQKIKAVDQAARVLNQFGDDYITTVSLLEALKRDLEAMPEQRYTEADVIVGVRIRFQEDNFAVMVGSGSYVEIKDGCEKISMHKKLVAALMNAANEVLFPESNHLKDALKLCRMQNDSITYDPEYKRLEKIAEGGK